MDNKGVESSIQTLKGEFHRVQASLECQKCGAVGKMKAKVNRSTLRVYCGKCSPDGNGPSISFTKLMKKKLSLSDGNDSTSTTRQQERQEQEQQRQEEYYAVIIKSHLDTCDLKVSALEADNFNLKTKVKEMESRMEELYSILTILQSDGGVNNKNKKREK